MNCCGVRVKEEEEPVDVDTVVASDLIHDRPITKDMSTSPPKISSYHIFPMKTEDQSLRGDKMAEQLHPDAKMADQCLLGLKIEDNFFTEGCQAGFKRGDSVVSGAHKFQIRVKMEDHGTPGTNMADQLLSGAKMEDQLLFKAKLAERSFSRAKVSNKFLSGIKTEEWPLPGAKMGDQGFSRAKTEEQLVFGAKMEDQFTSGAKMADQCLRAVLWQDMSVNLASTLLHQLSGNTHKHFVAPQFQLQECFRQNITRFESSFLTIRINK